MPRQPHTPPLLPDMPGHALRLPPCPQRTLGGESEEQAAASLSSKALGRCYNYLQVLAYSDISKAWSGGALLVGIGVVTPVPWPD